MQVFDRANGPRSLIRHQLGISYTGETGVKRSYMGGEMFAVYLRSSEIYKNIPHPRAWMYVTVNNAKASASWPRSMDMNNLHFHSALHEGESAENWGLEEVKMRLKELMGCDVPLRSCPCSSGLQDTLWLQNTSPKDAYF
jgi:hypothetical protein